MSYLQDLVIKRIKELGVPKAAEFFSVRPELIAQWRDGSKYPSLAAVEQAFDPDTLAQPGKIETATWEGRQVCLLLPFYKSVGNQTTFSLLGLMDRSRMKILMRSGDAFVAHTRNVLVEQFLQTDCEWSFWADDDMIFPIGNAAWFNRVTGFNLPDKFAGLHTINRLLEAKKTLVGGIYAGRTPEGKIMYAEACRDRNEAAWLKSGPHDQVKPTRWVATGCMLVHRSVYTAISERYPHLDKNWFTSSEHDVVKAVDDVLKILSDTARGINARVDESILALQEAKKISAQQSGLGTGEDIQFCLRASQVGHQPHVDCGLWCGHVGNFCFGPK